MSFRSIVRGVTEAVCKFSHQKLPPGNLTQDTRCIRMSSEKMINEKNGEDDYGGEITGHPNISHPKPFTLLLHVVQNNGQPMPSNLFMALNTAELIWRVASTQPVNVEVVTDREAVIELEEGTLAVGVVQQLQGSLVWGAHATEATCWILSWRSMMNIVREWETTRWRLQELEEERRNLVHDQEKQNEQFMEMLTKFGERSKEGGGFGEESYTEADEVTAQIHKYHCCFGETQ